MLGLGVTSHISCCGNTFLWSKKNQKRFCVAKTTRVYTAWHKRAKPKIEARVHQKQHKKSNRNTYLAYKRLLFLFLVVGILIFIAIIVFIAVVFAVCIGSVVTVRIVVVVGIFQCFWYYFWDCLEVIRCWRFLCYFSCLQYSGDAIVSYDVALVQKFYKTHETNSKL